MPQSLKNLAVMFPEKHAMVTAWPMLWDLGLKDAVRWVHEKISPCTDCADRDDHYDSMYDHLRDSPRGEKPANKMKIAAKLYSSVSGIVSETPKA
jgi:hypothetical protein